MERQHQDYLERCVELALASVKQGGGPFGALIARDGEVLGESANSVTLHCDPSAHAEVEAIRIAARTSGEVHLENTVLYSSCEPCPMCLAAAMWAHIPRIVYAATAADAARAGFDDTAIAMRLYGQARPADVGQEQLQRVALPSATAPFDAWLAMEDRREY